MPPQTKENPMFDVIIPIALIAVMVVGNAILLLKIYPKRKSKLPNQSFSFKRIFIVLLVSYEHYRYNR